MCSLAQNTPMGILGGAQIDSYCESTLNLVFTVVILYQTILKLHTFNYQLAEGETVQAVSPACPLNCIQSLLKILQRILSFSTV